MPFAFRRPLPSGSHNTTRPHTCEFQRKPAIRFDTGKKIHLADADCANVARTLFCWKCDSPEHLSHNCPHAAAVKDVITRGTAASHSGSGGRNIRNRPRLPTSRVVTASSSATNPSTASLAEESAGVATALITGAPSIAADLSETQWFQSFVVLRSKVSSLSRATFSPLRSNRPPAHFAPYPSPQAHQHLSHHLGSYRCQTRCCRSMTRERPHQFESWFRPEHETFSGVPLTVMHDPTVAITDFEGCDRFSVVVVVG